MNCPFKFKLNNFANYLAHSSVAADFTCSSAGCCFLALLYGMSSESSLALNSLNPVLALLRLKAPSSIH